MFYTKMHTVLCELTLVADDNGLKRIHMNTGHGRELEVDATWTLNDAFFSDVKEQIQEYLDGKRTKFTLKLNPEGTEYQKKVWQTLSEIPYGDTWTYKDIAIRLGNEKASRAVGSANGKNPIPLIVPCHRVIGSSGKLTGFAFGTEVKKKMIDQETILSVYNVLYDSYGPQYWWPAESVYEIMVGAILTQNTNWRNVDKALKHFADRLNPQTVLKLAREELIDIIRPCGFYMQKSERILAITNWFKKYDYDTKKAAIVDDITLRDELLTINGIGPETADCIMLYAVEKRSFVIDAYTRRVFERIGFEVPKDYNEFREFFMTLLPNDIPMFNEYHALIVEHCQNFCKKTPKCSGCPLRSRCNYFI